MTQTPIAAPKALAPEDLAYKTFSHSVNGKSVKVYAIEDNWKYFVTDTPDAPGVIASKTFSMPATSVHRFPGDPLPFNRKSYSATRSLPVARGRTIPGKPFVLTDGIETRQFSFTGSMTSLYSYVVSAATKNCTLISPSGASRAIVKNP
jgi:hypothetical protein